MDGVTLDTWCWMAPCGKKLLVESKRKIYPLEHPIAKSPIWAELTMQVTFNFSDGIVPHCWEIYFVKIFTCSGYFLGDFLNSVGTN